MSNDQLALAAAAANAAQASANSDAADSSTKDQKPPKMTVDLTRYPLSNYIRDNSLLSWMTALPVSPVPKPYSWSNEATVFFIMTLCEARWAGLITPTRLFQINRQERAPVWEYVRQRFCESGLYALVPGLTDTVLEHKYKSEIDTTFKPYKKLFNQQYASGGFDMDVAGQFTAPDELWEHHFTVKGNNKDAWLRQRGMPLWALYEEAFGEDVATGELAQLEKQQQKAVWTKYARNINNINPLVGPQHNVIHQPDRQMPSLSVPSAPNPTVSRPTEATPEAPRAVKRRRETMSSMSDVQSQMSDTLQKVSNSTIERMELVLNRQDDRNLRAYAAVRRLRLDKDIERAVRKALENNFNVVDVLEFEADKDEEGLRKWCLEVKQDMTPLAVPELSATPPRPPETTFDTAGSSRRHGEIAASMSDFHSRMAETLQQVSNSTLDRLESLLNKQDDQQLKAYSAIRRLKLGRDVEKAVKKALEHYLNVVDVLELEAMQDEEGLREWCLEID